MLCLKHHKEVAIHFAVKCCFVKCKTNFFNWLLLLCARVLKSQNIRNRKRIKEIEIEKQKKKNKEIEATKLVLVV